MKKKLITSALVAGSLGLATSANAATLFNFNFFENPQSGSITGNTYTNTMVVDSISLTITAVGGTTYSGGGNAFVANVGTGAGDGMGVTGGLGGGKANKVLSQTGVADGDVTEYETLSISFSQDVILNVGADVGGFSTTNNTGVEILEFVSSEGGTDSGNGNQSFSNITTLSAGQTLTVRARNTGDVAGVSSANSTLGLRYVQVYAEAVPEPSSAALLGLGGLALIMRRRK